MTLQLHNPGLKGVIVFAIEPCMVTGQVTIGQVIVGLVTIGQVIIGPVITGRVTIGRVITGRVITGLVTIGRVIIDQVIFLDGVHPMMIMGQVIHRAQYCFHQCHVVDLSIAIFAIDSLSSQGTA
uniref:Uncharacterized protein n=1 Tax=Opuntia streptacantha TaxID=393608 RepID=A0A7C8Z5Z3_OPUST